METIKKSRKSTLELSAKKIASAAETFYISNQTLGKDEEITCSSVSDLSSEDYKRCDITFDKEGIATAKIEGQGKYEGLNVCKATKFSARVVEGACPIATLASGTTFNQRIKQLVNTSATYNREDTTITSIEILGDGILPEGYTKDTLTALETKVDVSEKGDNSVVAYYDGNGKVYVYSEDEIIANEDASDMFYNYKGLTTLDVSMLNTSKVTDMVQMFLDCINLTIIDLSNADFTNVTDYENMLSSTSNLTKVYVKDETAKTFIDGIKSGVAEIKTA